jgi:ribonuclease III
MEGSVEPKDEEVARIEACEKRLAYHFRNPDLLLLALTHASDKPARTDPPPEGTTEAVPPTPSREYLDNERLEFLGDSVLGMIVCEELFHSYPQSTEGALTNVKSVVVSRPVLARLSDELGIPEFLSLGKGMAGYGRLPESMRANVFEAVVAAIYLDGGIEEARRFVLAHIHAEIELVESDRHAKNYKSNLQQYSQREFGITPRYRVTSEAGPDHVKEFEVVTIIGDQTYATGRGKSKKDAEQESARRTLEMLTGEGV